MGGAAAEADSGMAILCDAAARRKPRGFVQKIVAGHGCERLHPSLGQTGNFVADTPKDRAFRAR
jgi:hypothetical protein